jgi:hypothetical protein
MAEDRELPHRGHPHRTHAHMQAAHWHRFHATGSLARLAPVCACTTFARWPPRAQRNGKEPTWHGAAGCSQPPPGDGRGVRRKPSLTHRAAAGAHHGYFARRTGMLPARTVALPSRRPRPWAAPLVSPSVQVAPYRPLVTCRSSAISPTPPRMLPSSHRNFSEACQNLWTVAVSARSIDFSRSLLRKARDTYREITPPLVD